jgi:hypothetical protein
MTIKEKQCLLYFLGYYVGEIDGTWGTLSKTATKAFQKDYGITDDGICGATTEKALKHAVCYGMPAKKTSTAATTTNSTKTGWWKDIKYFDRSEFACHCGGKYCTGFPKEPQEKLIKVADKVRKYYNSEITVTSGVRCSKHNANVGGVSNSRHIDGKAMDFCVKGKTSAQVLAHVKTYPDIRYAYAIDGTYVHMDIN